MILFSFFDNFGMEGAEDYDQLFKVVFVGDVGVGKTQIIDRFVENKFSENCESTIAAEVKVKIVNCENKKIRLQLWDATGQEKYRSLIKSYYNGSHLIVFVYAVDDKSSFDNIQQIWVKEARSINENAKFLLVGNKCDLKEEKKVSTEEAIEYAGKNNMAFFEVSAKDEINIENMFNFIIQELLKDMEKEKEKIQIQNYGEYIDINHNKNLPFCDKYCSCCPCMKKTKENNEDQDNEWKEKIEN